MEYKQSEISDIKVLDETQGIVEAYTNSMGIVDSDGDVIEPSAFDNSIKDNMPIPALVGHNPSAVVGKVIEAQSIQQSDGSSKLYNKIQFNMETQAGQDAFSNISGGYVREWSVGFNIPENAIELDRDDYRRIRRIKDLDWVEVSSVLRGASPNTGTLSAKEEDSEQLQHADSELPESKSTEPEQSHSADIEQETEKQDERDTIVERLIASRLRQTTKRLNKGLNK